MSVKINEAVTSARDFFEIEKFPGDFFTLLSTKNYIEEYKILLFKEDIGKLSGFIGYGINDYTVICVNFKRSIGHQNFTLAHELGHWFLHKGQSMSDEDNSFYSSVQVEHEANEFASELLYPREQFLQDYQYIIANNMLGACHRAQLGVYVDELCHKYCLSFELVLRKILYYYGQGNMYKKVRKEIEKALGGKISECFEHDFYMPNEILPEYQKLMKPYDELKERVNTLVNHNKIGRATAESILIRNGVK